MPSITPTITSTVTPTMVSSLFGSSFSIPLLLLLLPRLLPNLLLPSCMQLLVTAPPLVIALSLLSASLVRPWLLSA